MAETLLSLSKVLLFGREVEDLQIFGGKANALPATVATTALLTPFMGTPTIDTIVVAPGDVVLVRNNPETENGLYTVEVVATNVWNRQTVARGGIVYVEKGKAHGDTFWRQKMPPASGKQRFEEFLKNRGLGRGVGKNKQLPDQLEEDARFARIYGFSYEGTYYELPNPTLFLVHGEGESATDGNQPKDRFPDDVIDKHASRAPIDPSRSGVGAADFQIADDIRVWAYDKADYTIRMDVETGMFEQVLLDVFFGVEAPMLAGGRVAGGRVAGGRVAGGRVAGGRVAGGRVSGGRVGGSSD